MPGSGILLFESDTAGGAAGTSDYVRDEFRDTALPATTNLGLSSTVSTNPLGAFFADSVLPRWMAKTLWIRDLQLIEDRTKWIGNKPTYKILWVDDFQGVEGYVYGGVTLQGTDEGKLITLAGIGDAMGLTGVTRRVAWIVKPHSGTATATLVNDAVDGSTVNFGSDSTIRPCPDQVISVQFPSPKQAYGLHDYRIRAIQAGTLSLYGVVVYSEIDGSGIDVVPGSLYEDKVKTTVLGTSLPFSGVSTFIGGKVGLFATQSGVGFTTSFIDCFTATVTGSMSTNLLNVSTGLGGSFPTGTGVFSAVGATHYLGIVTNRSGDVLTVSPTLPFAINSTLFSTFQAGHTFNQASGWTTTFDYNIGANKGLIGAPDVPYLTNTNGNIYPQISFVSPTQQNYVTGFTATISAHGGTFGIGFGASFGVLSIGGRMSALEIEMVCGQSSALDLNISVDGLTPYAMTEATLNQGVIRRRIFTNGGVGLHTVDIRPRANHLDTYISRVIALEPTCTNGPDVGKLAEIPIGMTFIKRNNFQAPLGIVERLSPNSAYFDNASQVIGSAGTSLGLFPFGMVGSLANVNESLLFTYFGTQFSVLGTQDGGSISITADGSPAGGSLGFWFGTGFTLGFHSVEITSLDGDHSPLIGGLDFLSPVTQLQSALNYDSDSVLGRAMQFFQGNNEPLGARPGDVWEVSDAGLAYQRIFGGWQQLNMKNASCLYISSAAQSIPDGPLTRLSFPTVVSDSQGMAQTIGSTFTIVIPQDGSYAFSFNRAFEASATGIRVMGLRVVGDTDYLGPYATPSAANLSAAAISIVVPNLKKGQRVVPCAAQNSGGALLTIADGTVNSFSCARVGP